MFELDRHILVKEGDKALDRGDTHQRHVCCAEYVQVTLTAPRQQLVHTYHEIHARAPRGLLAVFVKDAETAPEHDARDILHTVIVARVESREVEAIVLEIREATLDNFGEDVLFLVLEDNIADAVPDIDTTADIEDILCIEDKCLPCTGLENRVLCARTDVREDVTV